MAEYLIKVFGADPPCARCKAVVKVAGEVAKDLGLDIKIEHLSVTSEEAELYDILSTPAVVLNEKVVLAGRVPSKEEFKAILKKELGLRV
ncbi:MAG: thioredoxin family protein [Candidatus Methanomethylicaceae archaeon]